MCFFRRKRNKKSQINVSFKGEKFDLFRETLELEMEKFENHPRQELLESEIYSTLKKYCVECLYGTIYRSIEMLFTKENGNEILSLVVALSMASDIQKDPNKKKTLLSMAQELQNCHKELI